MVDRLNWQDFADTARDVRSSILDTSLESADQTVSFSPDTARKTLQPWAEALTCLHRLVDVKDIPTEKEPLQQTMEERIEIALGKDFPKPLFRWVSAEDLCSFDASRAIGMSRTIADTLAQSSTSRLSILGVNWGVHSVGQDVNAVIEAVPQTVRLASINKNPSREQYSRRSIDMMLQDDAADDGSCSHLHLGAMLCRYGPNNHCWFAWDCRGGGTWILDDGSSSADAKPWAGFSWRDVQRKCTGVFKTREKTLGSFKPFLFIYLPVLASSLPSSSPSNQNSHPNIAFTPPAARPHSKPSSVRAPSSHDKHHAWERSGSEGGADNDAGEGLEEFEELLGGEESGGSARRGDEVEEERVNDNVRLALSSLQEQLLRMDEEREGAVEMGDVLEAMVKMEEAHALEVADLRREKGELAAAAGEKQQLLDAALDRLSGTSAELKVWQSDDAAIDALPCEALFGFVEKADRVAAKLRAALHRKLQLREQEVEISRTCIICCHEPKTVLLLPCKHLAVCPRCSLSMLSCPICRSQVQSTLTIYDS